MLEEISYNSNSEEQPNYSQRELATEMGISLCKTNYCIKGLMEKARPPGPNPASP